MKVLFLVLGLILIVSCKNELPKGSWVYYKETVEEYDRFISADDGKILIEIMHPWDEPKSPWGIYKNGVGFGEYVTREQARTAAERILQK